MLKRVVPGGFGVKIDVFSMFSCFFVKIASAARVSRSETILVVSGDPADDCGSISGDFG